ncbi:hypothetical protein [Nostoc sp. UHCC 0302]|uniref:hypothetical protein n=1 Tax=Nostoc sp. UHCC 0302 TaxID=3134896 RepID=UPI00311C9583
MSNKQQAATGLGFVFEVFCKARPNSPSLTSLTFPCRQCLTASRYTSTPKMASYNQRSQQTKRLKLSVDPTLTLLTLVKTATAHHLSRKMMHLHE